MDEVLYHYTSKYHLPLILYDGCLALTESNLLEPKQGHKMANNFDSDNLYKPVVWLSRTAEPENCAIMSAAVDKSEILITLRKRPHYENWVIWSKNNRIKTSWAKKLVRNYTASAWYVSAQMIPLTSDEVVKIENTKTGEVLIDTDTGIRACSCVFEAPPWIPTDILAQMIGKRDIKVGGVVKFTL